jgi:hypothetical protein
MGLKTEPERFRWCRNIVVTPSPPPPNERWDQYAMDKYINGVLRVLQVVMSHNWAGYLMINEIATNPWDKGQWVAIVPKSKNQGAALTFGPWTSDKERRSLFADKRIAVAIEYRADDFEKGRVGEKKRADDVLAHELAHAYRMIYPGKYTGNFYLEEFWAHLIEAIYKSEKGRSDFTGYDGLPLQGAKATSKGFLSTDLHRNYMSRLYQSGSYLFRVLQENSNARFNPIKEFMDNKRVYLSDLSPLSPD